MSSNIRIEKTCIFCSNTFIAKTTRTKYCSHTCNRKHYKKVARTNKIKSATQNASTPEVNNSPILGQLEKRDFLSIQETSKLIGISERTLFRLIKSSCIKTTKLGRRTIIQRSSIDQLFQ